MEEFFEALDCRLRVSGLVADSIMIGIVNSTMEEAYRKVCSKESGLERLNERSRFCELAVMQLEWCLKFIQEETDNDLVGNSLKREGLVLELTETKNRIQKRLEETEFAITRIDRELTDKIENESKLRHALELKEQELKSLRSTLDLERVKGERVREFVLSNRINGEQDRDGDFFELRSSMDQQFWNIKQKLKDRRVSFNKEMQTISQSSPHPFRSEHDPEQDDGSCSLDDMNYSVRSEEERNEEWNREEFCDNVEICDTSAETSLPRSELNVAFEQIVAADIGVLKAMLEAAFEIMDNATKLSKTGMIEQKWRWQVEKETVAIVLKSFLVDVRERLEKNSSIRDGKVYGNWSQLLEDAKNLLQELRFLLDGIDDKRRAPIDKDLVSSSFSRRVDDKVEGLSRKHSRSGRLSLDSEYPMQFDHVAPPERCGKSDSSIILEEVFSEECQSGKDRNSASHYVADMIRNHECIIKKKTEEINWQKGVLCMEKGNMYHEKDKDLYMLKDKVHKLIQKLDTIIEANASCVTRSTEYGNEVEDKTINKNIWQNAPIETGEKISKLDDTIRNLKQELEDLSMQTLIREDTYMILFKELAVQMSIEVEKHKIQTLVMEDKFTPGFGDAGMDQEGEKESYEIEKHIREDIYNIVFGEVVRSLKCNCDMTLDTVKHLLSDERLKGDYVPRGNLKELKAQNINFGSFAVKDKYSKSLFDDDSDEYLNQTCLFKPHSVESGDALSHPVGGWEEANAQIASLEDKDLGVSPSIQEGGKDFCMLKPIVEQITDFTNVMTDFEHIMEEKLYFTNTRLKELHHRFVHLVHPATSLRKTELLYRKAFLRRCYDLQTAEAEVDLLGDEVDLLLGILEKAYVVLDHHSPILQNYFGVGDILKLIREELQGKAAHSNLAVR